MASDSNYKTRMASVVDQRNLQTRRTLLSRLRDWENNESWQEFFDIYWKFIYAMAVKSGLSDQEAEDAVQETILSVAKKMPVFEYNPEICSFKGWLMHVTRLRIIDQLRKRSPASAESLTPVDEGAKTELLEQMADPASLEANAVWDEEWRKNLMDAAMERVKKRIKPVHYQIFYLALIKKLSTTKVAEMLGVNSAQVYLIKHRIAKMVKEEVKLLEKRDEAAIGPSQIDSLMGKIDTKASSLGLIKRNSKKES